MKELIEKIVNRLKEAKYYSEDGVHEVVGYGRAIGIIQEELQGAEEYSVTGGWIPCSERLPECEDKYGWVPCIVNVIRNHYPTSTYDICDSPYDEDIVMFANYHVSQKIWHLDCDEQLNALINIEDSPLNGDYVLAWQPLPAPYKTEE